MTIPSIPTPGRPAPKSEPTSELESLGLTPSVVRMLESAGLDTADKIREYHAEHDITSVIGIGDATAEAILEAIGVAEDLGEEPAEQQATEAEPAKAPTIPAAPTAAAEPPQDPPATEETEEEASEQQSNPDCSEDQDCKWVALRPPKLVKQSEQQGGNIVRTLMGCEACNRRYWKNEQPK